MSRGALLGSPAAGRALGSLRLSASVCPVSHTPKPCTAPSPPRRFIGCVDYVWFTPGGGTSGGPPGADSWQLHPLSVLQPPPVQTLDCALPSPAWPSDHIALVADFALVPGAAGRPAEQRPPGRRRGKRAST